MTMISTIGTKVMIGMTIVASIAMIIGLSFQDPIQVTLPWHLADIFRSFIMLEAGFCVAMLLFLIVRISKVKLDENDLLMRPSFGFILSYFMLCFFVVVNLAQSLNTHSLSLINSPLAFVALSFSIVSIWKLSDSVHLIIDKIRGDNAKLKLTMTDTGKPGPDVDLAKEVEK